MTPRPRRERSAAVELPVARVAVDVGLAHLDRPFDYLVPEQFAEIAQPGVRVRVRFAGQMLDGFLLERVAQSEHDGRLAFLEKVVSPEAVLTPEIAELARLIADRYAGTLSDVLRLAVPSRHVRAEKARAKAEQERANVEQARAEAGGASAGVEHASANVEQARAEARPVNVEQASAGARQARTDVKQAGTKTEQERADTERQHVATHTEAARTVEDERRQPATGWNAYPQGASFLRALGEGRSPRAVWTALPGEDWPRRLAEAAAATARTGRGTVIVVADARDLDRVDEALAAAGQRRVALSAAIGPEERYRRFLQALHGDVAIVAGTRAAAFAPVADLGLVVIWDDGDDLHSEPRAPYPHAREVLLTRALRSDAAALVGGFGRTAEAAALLESEWAKEIVAERETTRARAPFVTPSEDDSKPQDHARLPTLAWRAARESLARDLPVLIQVPRRGYAPSVACSQCRTPARCEQCNGPLSLRDMHGPATCRWCARPATAYACPVCGSRALRVSVVGARRTAEELGRTFPDVPVWTSGRDGVLASVEAKPALVVSTPGAEPIVAGGGYGAVLLLDTWALMSRADLRAGEETLRRWLAAATLAVGSAQGGRVVVVADGALAPVQALVRFDPGWLASRDLAERRELGFPPAIRMASLTGVPAALADFLAELRLPDGADVLGPVPIREDQERFLVRVAKSSSRALAGALKDAASVRSARKSPDPVRVQVDPLDLL